ncbi:hypothetical protein SLEP1_g6687 [Rubroshorea leprosula]|uniref:Transmembrane protein n=1 Tax=Rubroshorea leprosula TaxID=152421 RepID=A0AAV5I6U7_9ROSI|nr:hypothetical protein SLEP1_g6687 [Rubroshorea leprosula]
MSTPRDFTGNFIFLFNQLAMMMHDDCSEDSRMFNVDILLLAMMIIDVMIVKRVVEKFVQKLLHFKENDDS